MSAQVWNDPNAECPGCYAEAGEPHGYGCGWVGGESMTRFEIMDEAGWDDEPDGRAIPRPPVDEGPDCDGPPSPQDAAEYRARQLPPALVAALTTEPEDHSYCPACGDEIEEGERKCWSRLCMEDRI